MPANLFLMWILPMAKAPTTVAKGAPEVTGSFFWATTRAGEGSSLLQETQADNLDRAPGKRPGWLRD